MESTNLPENPNKGKHPESNLKGKNGRPTDYLGPITDERAYNFGLLGYSFKETAKALGIANATFNRWIREKPSFRESLYAGKDLADAAVSGAFFKKATGFTQRVEKVVVVGDGPGLSHAELAEFTQYFPPDAGAALNWLKNRQPNLWSDKQQVEHSGSMQVTMDLDGGDAGGNGPDPEDTDYEEVDDDIDEEEDPDE